MSFWFWKGTPTWVLRHVGTKHDINHEWKIMRAYSLVDFGRSCCSNLEKVETSKHAIKIVKNMSPFHTFATSFWTPGESPVAWSASTFLAERLSSCHVESPMATETGQPKKNQEHIKHQFHPGLMLIVLPRIEIKVWISPNEPFSSREARKFYTIEIYMFGNSRFWTVFKK